MKMGIFLKVKERMNDDEKSVHLWKEEIELLEMNEKKFPNINKRTFIGALDESIYNTKQNTL